MTPENMDLCNVLYVCIKDPMWSNHAEISKTRLTQALEAIERLSKSIDLKDAAMRQLEADNKRLSAEVERQVEELGLLQTQMRNENAALRAQNEHLIRDDNVELSHAQEVANSLIERNVKLEQEIAALRAQIADAKPSAVKCDDCEGTGKIMIGESWAACPSCRMGRSHPAADAKDAERYRWLRDKSAYVGVNPHSKSCLWVLRGIYEIQGEGFDAAIDAAMKVGA